MAMELYESGLSQQQVEMAANWWVEAVRAPTYDNGDTSPQAGIVTMMAMLGHDEPPNDRLEAFHNGLTELLKTNKHIADFGLHVDYHPSYELGELAEQVGLDTGVNSFPWKTHMWFSDGGITVREGYGAPTRELLAKQNGVQS